MWSHPSRDSSRWVVNARAGAGTGGQARDGVHWSTRSGPSSWRPMQTASTPHAHTFTIRSFAQTARRARMPPLDLKRLFEEERTRRRAAAGASNSAEAAPERLEALEARPAVSMADHDVGRFAARRISGLHYVPEFVTEAEEEALLRSIRAPENDRRWTSGDPDRKKIRRNLVKQQSY